MYISVDEGYPFFKGHARHRLVLGKEALMSQGFPIVRSPLADEFSDSFLRDLAGNAFPATVVLAIVAGVIFAVEWKPPADDEEIVTHTLDVTAALKVLAAKRTKTNS